MTVLHSIGILYASPLTISNRAPVARASHHEFRMNLRPHNPAKLIKGAKDVYYPGAPHGITATHADQVNAELLKFLKS